MTLLMLLEMVASAFADRVAVGSKLDSPLTYHELHARAAAGATLLRARGAQHVAYVGPSHAAFPIALFAAAWAGVPLIPLNYRLAADQMRALLSRHDDVLVISDDGSLAASTISIEAWLDTTAAQAEAEPSEAEPSETDPDDIAVLLYTSGTTAEPKAVVLRHRHLASYVIGTVEFGASDEDEAALVSVPPYHVAGVANVITNVYAARRIVYLPTFTPEAWFDTVRAEGVTNALVVPTMLARLVDALGADAKADTPSLRRLAYGGARTPLSVLERALAAFADVDFVNAYGLTETSSTIAVLGPEDHRRADKLGSAGRVLPGIEVDVRDGEIWVRGEQVSGEYLGVSGALDADGWFPTRDRGWIDDDGYLFVEGRSDDTIIRGGENIAPAEIEDVLLAHPSVHDCAVVGLPDDEWGQRIAAAVVVQRGTSLDAEELREWARARLRTAKTPDVIVWRDTLPHTETGKLLRRQVLADLEATL